MIVLPSGRIIDLATDRSNYHALRQPGVGPASTHQQLYSLVDVIDGHGKFKTKAKYNNRDEAMAVIARHCRVIDLSVPTFFISEELH